MKQGKKNEKYEILLSANCIYLVKIKASSPEEACKILQDKINDQGIDDAKASSISYLNIWSDPSENGAAWLIAKEQPEGVSAKVMTWNGEEIQNHDSIGDLGCGFSSLFEDSKDTESIK